MSWMSQKEFDEFVATLPEKPKILLGVDRWMERVDKELNKRRAND
ncbi:hypothetical protein ES703_99643 [subsurface metagenome]